MNLIMFILSTIGMTHIIVDGSIMETPRNVFKSLTKKIGLESLGRVVDCYLCAGTWCGFFTGYIWLSQNPFEVFTCGCAGGFLANAASLLLNWIEASTMVNLPNDE